MEEIFPPRKCSVRLIIVQVLPHYRQLDRARRRERYEESLRLIQELIDCDDFEDISTFRVSLCLLLIFSCVGAVRDSFGAGILYCEKKDFLLVGVNVRGKSDSPYRFYTIPFFSAKLGYFFLLTIQFYIVFLILFLLLNFCTVLLFSYIVRKKMIYISYCMFKKSCLF